MSFGWQDYRNLIVVAHNQLKTPVVWVWDNLNVHLVDEAPVLRGERGVADGVPVAVVRS